MFRGLQTAGQLYKIQYCIIPIKITGINMLILYDFPYQCEYHVVGFFCHLVDSTPIRYIAGWRLTVVLTESSGEGK